MAKKQAFTVFDKAYFDWISELSQRYRQSQIKASIRINSEMLKFYWSVGKDIVERQFDNKYGSHFYENLSRDLSTALNNKRGMAPTSLRMPNIFIPFIPLCSKIIGTMPKIWSSQFQFIGKLPKILNCCFAYRGHITKKSLTKSRETAKKPFSLCARLGKTNGDVDC